MTTFFMILAVAWIAICFLVLIGILFCIVEHRGKVKRGTLFIIVLLFVGMSWGFDRVEEIKGAMDRESVSQIQGE